VPAGKVKISWAFDSDSFESRELVLKWVEQGGPLVPPPSRNGFGHLVIGEMIERSLNAKVVLEFAKHGLEWSVSIPPTNLVVIEPKIGSETSTELREFIHTRPLLN
jgi:hypothetical protein